MDTYCPLACGTPAVRTAKFVPDFTHKAKSLALFLDDQLAGHPVVPVPPAALDRAFEIVRACARGDKFDDAFLELFNFGLALRMVKDQARIAVFARALGANVQFQSMSPVLGSAS